MAPKKKKTKRTTKKDVKSRSDWTSKVLERLAATGNIGDACLAAGIGRTLFYKRRNSDPVFRADVRVALQTACDSLELEARRRAAHGVDEPVVYQGELCGVWINSTGQRVVEGTPGATFVPLTVKKYSDTLLIFLLKAHRPKKYRERHEIKHTGP